MRQWITAVGLWVALAAIMAAGFGCSSSRVPAPRTDIAAPVGLLPEDCNPWPGAARPGGAIVLALSQSVQADHAPVPHNDAERIVFRNLYETLVEVGCDGRLAPQLAESWESLQGDRVWVFTLREGVRYWDGSILEAVDVKTSWIAAQRCLLTEVGQTPLIWLNARNESVKVLDHRRLVITLPEPQADFPLILAHAALAVAVTRQGWRWPVGTGPCRLAELAGDPDPDLICLPHAEHRQPPVWERIVFRILPGRDPRDLLGRTCDALLVRDRSQLAYFQDTPGISITALPWDRLYLLLCPPEGTERERERWYTGWRRDELAYDVAAATAQPAPDPFFLPPTERLCPQMTGPVESLDWPAFSWEGLSASLDRDLILHPDDDPDARRLAERLAVVAARPLRPSEPRPGAAPLQPPGPPVGGAAPQAFGVPRGEFPGAVQSGRAGAYLMPISRSYASSCLQLSALLGMAHWLQQAGLDTRTASSLFPRTGRAHRPTEDFHLSEVTEVSQRLTVKGIVVPLVLTRPYLVCQGRLAGVRLAYDGSPLFGQAGWDSAGGDLP
jgi:hypothetical protein